jgi:hypothetical protein
MEGGSVRSLLLRPLECVATTVRAPGLARWFVAGCLAVCVVGGLVGGSSAAEGQEDSPEDASEYSAYADPEKPVLSYLLSEEGNIEEFKTEFGLDDEEVQAALAATREENQTLAEEFAESEQIVESNEDLPTEQVAQKIEASDYEEQTEDAVAETKTTIEDLLPEDRRDDLDDWVDAQWRDEVEEYHAKEDEAAFTASARGVTCRVFATQYIGYTRREVALPHKELKFEGGYEVKIRRGDRHKTRARVKEVGPWNIRDNYWMPRRKRDMWNLPQCLPEAEAAYYDNYNHGEDQFGREVKNPAGIDLTPRVARAIGLSKYENAWVRVRFSWARIKPLLP